MIITTTTRRQLASAVAAVVAFVVALVWASPAMACPSRAWQTSRVTSTQEGCGAAGLTVSASWRLTRAGVELRSVLADNDDAFRITPSLSVTSSTAGLLYSGPNGHGRVGDGLDYEWTRGHERNADGVRVRIGASDNNPDGWRTLKAPDTTIRVVVGEARYCAVTLTLPA